MQEAQPALVASAEAAAPAASKPPARRRRVVLPAILFAATVVTTFWAGAAQLDASALLDRPFDAWQLVANGWKSGLVYMASVMGMLLAHEMGHFLLAMRHRVPASLPFFIPMPLTPLGTMGAVIAVQGSRADRRQLFDIGLAGPLAGLL